MEQVDVIIPTYHPGRQIVALLEALQAQTVVPSGIIIMNTERSIWEEETQGIDFRTRFPSLVVHHIKKRDFDHALTRDRGISYATAPYVLLMTQDAMPAANDLIERLLHALQSDEAAVASYARQLPRKGASPEERYERYFNYPDVSRVQKAQDVVVTGFKTYYCSNVCALYKRVVYNQLGGFAERAIFNEDTVFAAKALKQGYHVCYAADAKVIHSHGLTCMEQLRRSFDQGVSQAMHPEVYAEVPPEGEGIRLVKGCTGYLLQHKAGYRLPYFYVKCAARLAGYRLGKHYRRLPRRVVRFFSMNPSFFGEID